MAERFETTRTVIDVLKVDESLGLVFGWGMECGLDTDGEEVTQAEMLKAVTEFSANSERPTDDMHDEEQDGTVVFSFPVTDEIAAAFGLGIEKRGWMIALKPSAETLAKYADGTYTGFSIGGTVEGWEPAGEAAA